MKVTLTTFVSIAFFSIAAFAGRDLSELAAGGPRQRDAMKLPPGLYVETEMAKLANPKLLWLNSALLREMGYEVPQVLDAVTEKKILDGLAWVTVDQRLQPGDVGPERRKMVADHYGGTGIGSNLGSARAVIAGDVQIKGSGTTPLQRVVKADHTARSTLHEALKDAIWGEVLNNELPFGANRIIAIIDRGGVPENGEPQILEVRVDPTRLGHFQPNYMAGARATEAAKLATRNLERLFPAPQGGHKLGASIVEKIIAGNEEFARRIGRQYANLYMRRLFHGATSESNIEINGRMIDFGTATAQPGYEPVEFLAHIDAFGARSGFRYYLLESTVSKYFEDVLLAEGFRARFGGPQELGNRLSKIFEAAFAAESSRMALVLSGIPEAHAEILSERHAVLARTLVAMTEDQWRRKTRLSLSSLEALEGRDRGPFEDLIHRVHAKASLDSASLRAVVEAVELAHPLSIQTEGLAEGLASMFKDAAEIAARDGVRGAAFRRLLRENARFANRPMSALYMPEFRAKTKALTQAYMGGAPVSPEKMIVETFEASIRTVRGLDAYEAPVRVLEYVDGKAKVEIFDARKNKLRRIDYVPRDRHLSPPMEQAVPRVRSCRSLFAAGA